MQRCPQRQQNFPVFLKLSSLASCSFNDVCCSAWQQKENIWTNVLALNAALIRTCLNYPRIVFWHGESSIIWKWFQSFSSRWLACKVLFLQTKCVSGRGKRKYRLGTFQNGPPLFSEESAAAATLPSSSFSGFPNFRTENFAFENQRAAATNFAGQLIPRTTRWLMVG